MLVRTRTPTVCSAHIDLCSAQTEQADNTKGGAVVETSMVNKGRAHCLNDEIVTDERQRDHSFNIAHDRLTPNRH